MFVGKDERGEFILDPNEAPFAEHEIDRASRYLELWHNARRKRGDPPAGPCPHEDYPCAARAECVEKIAWWRRYIREIEGGV